MKLDKKKIMKESIEKIESNTKDCIELLKDKDGCAYVQLCLPNINKEQYEKWQLGQEGIDGSSVFMTACNTPTLVVLLNQMEMLLDKVRKDHPEIVSAELEAQIMNRMVINEEDIEEED